MAKNILQRTKEFLFGAPPTIPTGPIENRTTPVSHKSNAIPVGMPHSRVSLPNQPVNTAIVGLQTQYRVVNRDFVKEVIPLIRKLVKINPDFGQALNNIVTLGNTGHKICFDRTVDPEQVDEMRNHLINRYEDWSAGCAGMDGLINKMFSQILIGGALSNEWVPLDDLSGIETVILVNPEEIEFVLEKGNKKYSPYQRVVNGFIESNFPYNNLIKLNTNTYKYYALNGDTEIPYGFPPYMAGLPPLASQNKMNKNIDFIIDQLGLLGFLHAMVGKPEQNEGEGDEQYDARLDQFLGTVKDRLSEGIKDGVVVGFKDDTEFEYQSISRAFQEALSIFENNELQLASGLKQDATLWGRAYSSSETQITVIFIKMLSELRNIQNLVKTNIEFGYALELRLAGYVFDYLTIEFNRSTLQDDLKYQQAQEIKLRNVKDKRIMGIIDQNQAADELGYEAPAFDDPMVPWEILAGGSIPNTGDNAAASQKREKGKNVSDKKSRASKKPVSKQYK